MHWYLRLLNFYAKILHAIDHGMQQIIAWKIFPNLSGPKTLDYIVSLGLGPLRVDDIHVEPIIYQLMKQFLRSVNALDEDKHGRSETLQGCTAVFQSLPQTRPPGHNIMHHPRS